MCKNREQCHFLFYVILSLKSGVSCNLLHFKRISIFKYLFNSQLVMHHLTTFWSTDCIYDVVLRVLMELHFCEKWGALWFRGNCVLWWEQYMWSLAADSPLSAWV